MNHVLIAFDPDPGERRVIESALKNLAQVDFLPDLNPAQCESAFRRATVVVAGNLRNELRDEDFALLEHAKMIQILPAGANRVPFDQIRGGIMVASNVGAYAEPMAEHVLAMILALGKNLVYQDQQLVKGVWDRQSPNRMLRGLTAGIVGFGGIGRAVATLLRPFEMRIVAVSRSGSRDPAADLTRTLDDLEEVFGISDVVCLSLPLTNTTRGLIGRTQLQWMKPDAILINVARGALIDEEALYDRASEFSDFKVGLDVWWEEPFPDGRFHTMLPILDLPNVIGSPHNSGHVPESGVTGVSKATENVRRFLTGEPVSGVVDPGEYT